MILAIATLAVVALPSLALACPTCKDSLASSPEQQGMVQGYFYSILFMMAMPFVLLGSFGSYAYLLVRRARAEQQDREASPGSAAGPAQPDA
jgi:uncharacterized membrane protein